MSTLLRILLGLIIAFAVLVLLAWLFQERMAFPAPSGGLPDAAELKRQGVGAVFQPGSSLRNIVEFIRGAVKQPASLT